MLRLRDRPAHGCMLRECSAWQRGATLSHPPPLTHARSIPVAAWYDGPAGLSKVTLFGGVDMVLVDGEGEWDVHPRIDREKCYAFPARGDGAAPVRCHAGCVGCGGRDIQGDGWTRRHGDMVGGECLIVEGEGRERRLLFFDRRIIEAATVNAVLDGRQTLVALIHSRVSVVHTMTSSLEVVVTVG
eukprot:364028-Chlamydomonas_euryale.AAC.6